VREGKRERISEINQQGFGLRLNAVEILPTTADLG
jgi:hypothetical protein